MEADCDLESGRPYVALTVQSMMIVANTTLHSVVKQRGASIILCRALSEVKVPLNFPSRTKLDELDATFIRPHIFSIEQLPEISSALNARKNLRKVNLEELDRAAKVFSSIQPGGNEHKATLALMAECQDPVSSIKTLTNLKHYPLKSREDFALKISLAKALWLNGQFKESESICTDMIQNDGPSGATPLLTASTRTGQAIGRICLASSLDDMFSIRDPFRMVVRSLEGMPSLALALALLNYGTAEAIYAQVVAREHGVEAPLDGAMRAWRQGLTTLKRLQGSSILASSIQAQLLTQMAWGMLQMGDEEDNIKRASEYAGDALKVYDKFTGLGEHDMRRTLGIIATCLHKTSSAVTAEGLFQSAIDIRAIEANLFDRMQLRDNLEAYADLLQDWENREREGEKLRDRAGEAVESLPTLWKEKPSIYATLWFWTPSLFSKPSI